MEKNEKNSVLKFERKKRKKRKKGWCKKEVRSGGVNSESERSEKGLKGKLKRQKRLSVSGL